MNSDDISDAKFKEINDVSITDTQEPQLLATYDGLQYLRHPLAKQNADYAVAISKEIDLDRELGLAGQIDLDSKSLLKKDIDELHKGDEAGILFEGNVKIEKGDILVAYIEGRKKGEL